MTTDVLGKLDATAIHSASNATRKRRNRRHAGETRAYRLLYAQCFLVFLVVGLVNALMPRRMQLWQGDGENSGSAIDFARRASGEVVPWVFMH